MDLQLNRGLALQGQLHSDTLTMQETGIEAQYQLALVLSLFPSVCGRGRQIPYECVCAHVRMCRERSMPSVFPYRSTVVFEMGSLTDPRAHQCCQRTPGTSVLTSAELRSPGTIPGFSYFGLWESKFKSSVCEPVALRAFCCRGCRAVSGSSDGEDGGGSEGNGSGWGVSLSWRLTSYIL